MNQGLNKWIEGEVNDRATVPQAQAKELVERMRKGEDPKSLLKGQPPSVRALVKEICEKAGMTMEKQREFRRARITQLLAQDDPGLVVKGVELSQKEENVGVPRVAVQVNHYDQPAPDGGALLADKE